MAFVRPNVNIALRPTAFGNSRICSRPPLLFRMTVAPVSPAQTRETNAPTNQFGVAVSGEWFGVECFFSVLDASAQCIHERYVPDAFREWGVEIRHFETVASTRIDDELQLKHVRALPSVGCEADAVTTEDQITSGINATWIDGSFVAGGGRMLCVAHPDSAIRERVRVQSAPTSRSLSVTIEKWDAPYCDAAILPGCGGTLESFAHEQRIDAASLKGKWLVCDSQGNERVIERDVNQVQLMLPRGISIEATCVRGVGWRLRQVGWLAQSGDARTVVRCDYEEDGTLTESSWHLEKQLDV